MIVVERPKYVPTRQDTLARLQSILASVPNRPVHATHIAQPPLHATV